MKNMKKYLLILASIIIASCASDEKFEELNKDPNNPTSVSSEALFTSATKALFDQMESTNVNNNIYRLLSQYWTETTYVDESNYDFNTRAIPQNHWSRISRDVLFDLQDAKKLASNDKQKAMISVIEVYAWQQMVDTYGDIPYTDALKGAEEPTPAYNDDAAIYTDLIVRINDAITKLNGAGTGYTSADIIFNGDIAKWKKFANSVKLKIAMRMADANNTAAQTAAQEAVTGGVLASNSDNVILNYQGSTPNTNPLWIDLVQTGRSDFLPANTIVDYMNAKNDPRRAYYFDNNMGTNVYSGATYGAVSNFLSYSHIGKAMHQPTFRGVLLDYAEVRFLLAEAVERGYNVGGTAADHYTAAIEANMTDWGVASADIATYLARTDVAYATATGTWREKIGFQFWLAMYNRGFEGWSVKRKYDAPAFNTAAVSGLPLPTRYTYPLNEPTLNKSNYDAAKTAMGGDTQTTKIFWDKF